MHIKASTSNCSSQSCKKNICDRDNFENSIKVQIDPFTPGIRNEQGMKSTSNLLKTEEEDMKKINFHVY